MRRTTIRTRCAIRCCTYPCRVQVQRVKKDFRAPRVFAGDERKHVYIFMRNSSSKRTKTFRQKKSLNTPIVEADAVRERDYGVDKKFNMFLKFPFVDSKRTSVLFIKNEIVFSVVGPVHCT